MLFALLRMWPITLTGTVEHQSDGNANKYKALCGGKLILIKGFVSVTNTFLYSSLGPAALKGNVTRSKIQELFKVQCLISVRVISSTFTLGLLIDTVAQKRVSEKTHLWCHIFKTPHFQF